MIVFKIAASVSILSGKEAKKLHQRGNHCTFVATKQSSMAACRSLTSWLREESPGNTEHHIS